VHRSVQLVADFADISTTAVGPRAIAEHLCQRFAQIFDGASALVFEREEATGTARVVAGAHVPAKWAMRAIGLREIPLIRVALEDPSEVHVTAVAAESASLWVGRERLQDAPYEALCAAVPDPTGPSYVVLALMPTGADDAVERTSAVDIVRQLLWSGIALAAGDGTRARTLSSVYHAKLDWEQTADAIESIVAVLDERRRVVRINRAVERWLDIPVRDAVGRDIHGLFHDGCQRRDCRLARQLRSATSGVTFDLPVSFELFDEVLGRDLVFDLRPTRDARGADTVTSRLACTVTDVSALRKAERELLLLNQSLEEKIRARTHELTETNWTLREEVARRRDSENLLVRSRRELAELSNALVEARESERKRIAQDLHDSVGQALTAIKYSLENAHVLMAREQSLEAAVVLESATRGVRDLIVDVRSIAMNLRPALLDDLGAVSALRYLCREWQNIYSKIALKVDISVEDEDIPLLLATDVFRSVQELLNNVARHAQARKASVSVARVASGLVVTVEDDGEGFAVGTSDRRADARGLKGLRERTDRIGGRCEVRSVQGAGTRVTLEWPDLPLPVIVGSREVSLNA
jgi:signal transduction histidine kinase